jgi:hypothetical protein
MTTKAGEVPVKLGLREAADLADWLETVSFVDGHELGRDEARVITLPVRNARIVDAWAPVGYGRATVVKGGVRFDPGPEVAGLAHGKKDIVCLEVLYEDQTGKRCLAELPVSIEGKNLNVALDELRRELLPKPGKGKGGPALYRLPRGGVEALAVVVASLTPCDDDGSGRTELGIIYPLGLRQTLVKITSLATRQRGRRRLTRRERELQLARGKQADDRRGWDNTRNLQRHRQMIAYERALREWLLGGGIIRGEPRPVRPKT